MRKGEATRQAVIERATVLARTVGLEGLTIGGLSEALNLSKSGLFAHFRSKENLQIQVIEQARRDFVAQVVVPALKKPRGEPRLGAGPHARDAAVAGRERLVRPRLRLGRGRLSPGLRHHGRDRLERAELRRRMIPSYRPRLAASGRGMAFRRL